LPGPRIQRVLVWSPVLRITHWVMALSVLALLLTGWLLGRSAELYQALLDYHYIAGYALIGALILRLPLLFLGKGAEHVLDLLPRREQRRAVTATLRFYLSGARAPLPRWYAHNPLWGPLYLALFVLLFICALTGIGYDTGLQIGGIGAADLHRGSAALVAALALAHLIAVVMHDLRGTASDVSGMINGHRIFVVEPLQVPIDTPSAQIDLRQITGREQHRGPQGPD
jgi:Ni/Fe-hydrogenase 1 B-type cytochrome subunit